MRRLWLLVPALLCVATATAAVAQSRGNIWHFGSGCATKGANLPHLALVGMPVVGRGFRLEIRTGQPRARCLLFLGGSNTTWQGQKLPLDLGPNGFAGCQLLVSPDFTVAFSTDAQGFFSLPIPTTGLGVGLTGYMQLFTHGLTSSQQSFHAISDGVGVRTTAPLAHHTVVVLPDTQKYVQYQSQKGYFEAQTQLIIQRRTAQNMVFVSHLGDMVHNGAAGQNLNGTEWARALLAMVTLDGDLNKNKDGLIPYSVVIGNHDYDTVNNKSSAKQFLQFFGPQRYKGRSWFVGASASGLSMAQVFRAGAESYLHVGIEWDARDQEIEWAQGVLAKHPELPAILSTHAYVNIGNPAPRRPLGHTPSSGGNNSGFDVFYKLVEPNPQIFMVVNGHVLGEGRRTSTTVLGQTVHEMLSNYQGAANGGNGWMRQLQIQPDNKVVKVSTVSPTYIPGLTKGIDYAKSSASNFQLAVDTYAHRSFLQSHRVLRFRSGQDFGHGAYKGTQDTYVGNGRGGFTKPGLSYGNETSVHTDGNGDQDQGLLRFDGILGQGPGQVPPQALIKKAILTLTTEGQFSVSRNGSRFYRMTKAWSETSTWNSLASGIQVGSETRSVADADSSGAVSKTGTRSFDVTRSVQAWANGETNLGWGILCNGTDAWWFRSSEWGTVAERPMLTVIY